MSSPAVLANNTKITLNSIDFSGDLNQAKLNITTSTVDVSVFGITGWKEFITSISEWALDLTGFFDKAASKDDATLFALFGAPLSPTAVTISIPNASTGSVQYSGNVYAKSYASDGKTNDAWKITAALQGTGALTRTIL